MITLVFLGFVLGTPAAALALYWSVRRGFFRNPASPAADAARNMGIRVAALHALVVAFMFADLQATQTRLASTVAAEAGGLINILIDVGDFAPEPAGAVGVAARAYARSVIDVEWPAVRHTGRAAPATRQALLDLRRAAQALAAVETPNVYDGPRLVDDVFRIEDQRQDRLLGLAAGASTTFWMAAIAGLVVTVLCLAAEPPGRDYLLLVLGYTGFIGLMFYLIWDLGNTFYGAITVSPEPFMRVLEFPGAGISS